MGGTRRVRGETGATFVVDTDMVRARPQDPGYRDDAAPPPLSEISRARALPPVKPLFPWRLAIGVVIGALLLPVVGGLAGALYSLQHRTVASTWRAHGSGVRGVH